MFLNKIFLQGIGGFNDGLGQSSSRFMEIIHAIQAFQDWVTTGWYDFLDGMSIVLDFFGA
jgi:hypothetical protein